MEFSLDKVLVDYHNHHIYREDYWEKNKAWRKRRITITTQEINAKIPKEDIKSIVY